MGKRRRAPIMKDAWPMNTKERWLAAIYNKSVDRLPFWPKLTNAYPPHQKSPFRTMSIAEIHDWVGSDKHVGIPGCLKIRRKKTSIEEVESKGIRRVTYGTPVGELLATMHFDTASASWHPTKFPIESVEDVKTMTLFFADADIDIDDEGLEKSRHLQKTIGDDAVTNMHIGESPLMEFIERLAGVEKGHYLLIDCRQAVEELFLAMHESLLKKTRIIAECCPADLLYFIENTSTTLISPAQFRTYCMRHIDDYGAMIQGAHKPMILHMCGFLKDILPDLAGTKARAFEAFTTPTLGNATLADGRKACPDQCLIGGTNAMLWCEDARSIIRRLEKDLDALPHHRGLVVTSAGVMPPFDDPAKIREVCQWVKGYRIRM
jgi:hypothetical protein